MRARTHTHATVCLWGSEETVGVSSHLPLWDRLSLFFAAVSKRSTGQSGPGIRLSPALFLPQECQLIDTCYLAETAGDS